MKRWELLLAGLILCSFPVSAYNVFAPNSFEDVQPDSYAYQTLRDMCGQGKIPGYSTSFFDSGRKISRYELAGVLQSALKYGKDLSSKDKEALQRLKKEYAREREDTKRTNPDRTRYWKFTEMQDSGKSKGRGRMHVFEPR